MKNNRSKSIKPYLKINNNIIKYLLKIPHSKISIIIKNQQTLQYPTKTQLNNHSMSNNQKINLSNKLWQFSTKFKMLKISKENNNKPA